MNNITEIYVINFLQATDYEMNVNHVLIYTWDIYISTHTPKNSYFHWPHVFIFLSFRWICECVHVRFEHWISEYYGCGSFCFPSVWGVSSTKLYVINVFPAIMSILECQTFHIETLHTYIQNTEYRMTDAYFKTKDKFIILGTR